MSRAAWIVPLLLAPFLALGLLLWRDQETTIWLSGVFAACL
jgi:hypothetical protein